MKKIFRFILGVLLGFGLSASTVALLFFTVLCVSAMQAIMAEPSISMDLIRSTPRLFWPLLRILFAEFFFGVLTALLYFLYRRYMRTPIEYRPMGERRAKAA